MCPIIFEPFMHIDQLIPMIKDVVLATSAAIGAGVAIKGLSTWKRQTKWNAEYELARRLLKLTYRLREAIRQVRHPVMWANEMPSPPENVAKEMTPEQRRYFGTSSAYQARWEKISAVRTEFGTELLEAEALWGSELKGLSSVLENLERELYIAIRDHLMLCDPDGSDEMKKVIRKKQSEIRDIMYDSMDESSDEFSKNVLAAIQPIEDYLKFYLRR